ncbi:putative S-layer protein [Candidatus Pacearchaeota archaeon]|nr:putative S-layer protein [Candidatus Pacearchaeota archaeon]
MTNKIFALFALSIFVFAFLVMGVSAETITFALTVDDIGVSTNTNLAGTFVSGSGVTPNPDPTNDATDGAETTDWTMNAAVDATEFYQVTLTPLAGFNFAINSISFKHRADEATTPMLFVINYSNDNFVTSKIITTTAVSSTDVEASYSNLAIKLPVSATAPLVLRIFAYDADSAAEVFSIKDLVLSGDLVPTEVITCLATPGSGNGKLLVGDLELSVVKGYGEDEQWFPFDTVNIESNIEYRGSSDFKMRSIEPKWGLFDRTTNKWIIDDEDKSFNLEGGDDQDVIIEFKLDEKIKTLVEGDIISYIIATGDDKENDLETCEYEELSVDMQLENALVMDNIQAPETVQCSENVLVTADIWNIGDDELEANSVFVFNTELGVDQKIEIGDLKAFKSTGFEFAFSVPKDAIEKEYQIDFTIKDEDDNVFDINDGESKFRIPLTVSGGCAGTSSPVTVSASLVSGGKAGQPLTVRATVTNSGTNTANYTVNAAGYGQWADSATLSETTFSLNAGQSKDVTITLATKSGVSGEQTFNVEVLSGNQLVMTQPVSVVLESSGFLSSITGGAIGGNATIWLIGLVNVILVLAIIMVAVRFFRK